MTALRKTDARLGRKAKPTGEKFDAVEAFARVQDRFPVVMARLAE